MGRNIVIAKKSVVLADAGQNTSQQADNYASQIVKLIPVEIVGVYLGISNLIESQPIADNTLAIVQSIVFLVILVITPFYLSLAAGIKDKAHIIIATVSFIIWSISLGGPLDTILKNSLPEGLSIKFLGGILIMIYTLIVPMFYKAASKD